MSCAYRSPHTGKICGKLEDDSIHCAMAVASFYATMPPHRYEHGDDEVQS